jgi:tetratricopeptide (TPR) repeat protein
VPLCLCGLLFSVLSSLPVFSTPRVRLKPDTTAPVVSAFRRTGQVRQAAPSSLGKIVFPNSGSPAAQPAFVKGVLLLHSFEYDDAIEAFRQAEKTDPTFALAYWGEAMCYNQSLWYNENLEKARAALARLGPSRDVRAAKAPTEREKGYLDAVELLFGTGDKAARDRAYADRMAALSRRFPDDDEAAAFYALALLATIPSGQRNTDISLKAGAIATAILKKNPEHPGAAHYALHAFDDGEHAAMGLPAARTYARIAPASSHARHMPSHVFLPLGMWDEAAASDESSFAASVDRVKRLGLSMAQADFHSLSWLHYEYLQQGRFAKARQTEDIVRKALADAAGPAKAGHYRDMFDNRMAQSLSVASGFKRTPPPVSVVSGVRRTPSSASVVSGFSRTTPQPTQHPHVESEIGRGFSSTSLKSELGSMRARRVVDAGAWGEMKGQGTFENIDELFALGQASLRAGDTARAAAALEHLANASRSVPDRDAREIALIMHAELDGLTRLGSGDRAGGLAALARAEALEAKRPRPIARPYPIKPAGELYAEALLETGDAVSAMSAFQKALARTPRRAAALLGLARAAQKAGKKAEAVAAAKEFLTIWDRADTNRPELAEARGIAR